MSADGQGGALHHLLLTRRTIHAYEPGAVSEEAVWRALEAAHHAPNHKLTWPWRFNWAGPETRERLTALAVKIKERAAPLADRLRRNLVSKVSNPAHLVAVSLIRSEDTVQAREDYGATACAIQNFMLSLHGDGVGSKWGTGELTRDGETYDLLGISQATEEIIGFVWVGVPAVVPDIQRPDLSDFVRRLP